MLWIALTWTAIVAVFCLISMTDIPRKVTRHDKLGHAVFHFGIASLWFLYFRLKREWTVNKSLLTAFLISLVFGITMEILQYYFTNTRSAEIRDVLANSGGALLAIVTMRIAENTSKQTAIKKL